MKRKHILTLLLASFFIVISFQGLFVYASISGDDLCGGINNKCGVEAFKKLGQGFFSLIISLGTPLLVVFVIYRFVMAWYALNQGNANAYKEATQKAGQAVLGFLIIVAIMGGLFLSLLRFFGVQEPMLKLLKEITVVTVPRAYAADPYPKGACPQLYDKIYSCITNDDKIGYCQDRKCNQILNSKFGPSKLCNMSLVGYSCILESGEPGLCSHRVTCEKPVSSYEAQTATSAPATTPVPVSTQEIKNAPQLTNGGLPNPVGVTNLYDFILSAIALVMRFFIYPALIAMWVWSGFLYVWAQGAPEKLAKAHKLVLWAFISTLIVFVTQGFLSALRGSVQKILPKTSQEVRIERAPLSSLINQ